MDNRHCKGVAPIHRKISPVSSRRRRRQGGLEAIEFGLWSLLLMPPFIWMFISGMNFIRYNKAGDVTRSTAMMYIKGVDMTAIGNQRIIARVASGLGLVVESGGALVSNQGNGMVALSKVVFVDPNCGCTNAGQYVLAQRIYMGNRSLDIAGTVVDSFAGPVPTALWTASTGNINNYTTDTRARVSSDFTTLWGNSLGAGQFVYVVESFFKAGTGGAGQFDSNGTYTRVFM